MDAPWNGAKMMEELARDYASYGEVGVSGQAKYIRDNVEDTMVRLEEFESIIGMVQATVAECTSDRCARSQLARPQLLTLFRRIDALECVVARANVDLSALEAAVDCAEDELGGVGISDRLRGMLNPLSHIFRTKNSETGSAYPRFASTFQQPSIYRADDFFGSE